MNSLIFTNTINPTLLNLGWKTDFSNPLQGKHFFLNNFFLNFSEIKESGIANKTLSSRYTLSIKEFKTLSKKKTIKKLKKKNTFFNFSQEKTNFFDFKMASIIIAKPKQTQSIGLHLAKRLTRICSENSLNIQNSDFKFFTNKNFNIYYPLICKEKKNKPSYQIQPSKPATFWMDQKSLVLYYLMISFRPNLELLKLTNFSYKKMLSIFLKKKIKVIPLNGTNFYSSDSRQFFKFKFFQGKINCSNKIYLEMFFSKKKLLIYYKFKKIFKSYVTFSFNVKKDWTFFFKYFLYYLNDLLIKNKIKFFKNIFFLIDSIPFINLQIHRFSYFFSFCLIFKKTNFDFEPNWKNHSRFFALPRILNHLITSKPIGVSLAKVMGRAWQDIYKKKNNDLIKNLIKIKIKRKKQYFLFLNALPKAAKQPLQKNTLKFLNNFLFEYLFYWLKKKHQNNKNFWIFNNYWLFLQPSAYFYSNSFSKIIKIKKVKHSVTLRKPNLLNSNSQKNLIKQKKELQSKQNLLFTNQNLQVLKNQSLQVNLESNPSHNFWFGKVSKLGFKKKFPKFASKLRNLSDNLIKQQFTTYYLKKYKKNFFFVKKNRFFLQQQTNYFSKANLGSFIGAFLLGLKTNYKSKTFSFKTELFLKNQKNRVEFAELNLKILVHAKIKTELPKSIYKFCSNLLEQKMKNLDNNYSNNLIKNYLIVYRFNEDFFY